MNETDYNARLYEKMKAEQDKYRDWLLHQEPSEILNHKNILILYHFTTRSITSITAATLKHLK